MSFKQTFPNIVAEWNSDNIFTSVRNAIKKKRFKRSAFFMLEDYVLFLIESNAVV